MCFSRQRMLRAICLRDARDVTKHLQNTNY